MARIYDIKVRYMRRVQMREYEPSEAEVTLSAQIEDDEDYNDTAASLMVEAREVVKVGLTGKLSEDSKFTSVKEQVETKSKPKGKAPMPKKAKTTIPDDVIPDGVEPDAPAEPEVPVKKVATKKKAPPKKVVRDPVPEPDGVPDDAPVMSIKELQEFVGSAVTSRKIKPVQIKEIISAYNAVRLSDIPEANRSSVKVAIENAMLLE